MLTSEGTREWNAIGFGLATSYKTQRAADMTDGSLRCRMSHVRSAQRCHRKIARLERPMRSQGQSGAVSNSLGRFLFCLGGGGLPVADGALEVVNTVRDSLGCLLEKSVEGHDGLFPDVFTLVGKALLDEVDHGGNRFTSYQAGDGRKGGAHLPLVLAAQVSLRTFTAKRFEV
jgi:hypothetical protein